MSYRILLLTIVLISIKSTILLSQNSEVLKVTHFPGNTLVNNQSKFVAPKYIRVKTTTPYCFPYLDVSVYVKESGYKEKPYRFRVVVTNKSNYTISISTSVWGFGTGGRSTIKPGATYDGPGGNDYAVKNPEIEIYNVTFEFDDNTQNMYGVGPLSNPFQCRETPSAYLSNAKAKKDKKSKILEIKGQIYALSSSKEDLIKKKSLWKTLSKIDTDHNYSNKINEVENALQQAAIKEAELLAKSKNDNQETKDLPIEEIPVEDIHQSESMELNQSNEEVVKLEEEQKLAEQQKLEEQRRIEERLKQLKEKEDQEIENAKRIAEATTSAVETIVRGAQDGVITSIGVGLTSRDIVGDELIFVPPIEYNLNLEIYHSFQLAFGFGYGEDENTTESLFSISVGSNIINKNDGLLKFGILLDFATYDQEGNTFGSNRDESANYYGIMATGKLLKILEFGYGYGIVTGTDYNDADVNEVFSIFRFSANIPF